MTAFDIIALSVLGLTVAMGFWKGLAAQVFGLAGLVVGYVLSVRFYRDAAGLLPDINPGTAKIAGFLVIFISCIIAAFILGRLLGKLLKIAGLGWANRLMGGMLGLVKGALVVVVILVVVVAFLPDDNRMLKESVTMPYFISISKVFGAAIPEDIKARYKSRIELFHILRNSTGITRAVEPL